MAKIRKRTLPSGATRYLVDYKDQAGKRRFKQFKKRKFAEEWMTTALFEVQQGTHTPASAKNTLHGWKTSREPSSPAATTFFTCSRT